MARETPTKAILETWEAGGGSLSSLQQTRLQELQNASVKLSEDLDTCKADLAASKKRSQHLFRSKDLRTNSVAVSDGPLIDPHAKGPKLISPDQEEEDQPDDGGLLTPACPTCNEKEPQSSDKKGARVEKLRARLRELL
ncbi:uncharacterized protein BKA55DRAFT_693123 [Fusarium redolens]|uniref:Uncharacterized protein n=1 Tax=Fusarium redolens TaxID=48865 RepID=A0A9P9GLK6_FUSRE|nr:uncharacterized protein BKA55DRAFT_693123 [Fusarium redolens]KAH7240878.1 hypothetical protein BKA55DRAFT_693123 [Fusarium redolens]